MSADIVPIVPGNEEITQRALEFLDWLREETARGAITAVSVRGICSDGETFQYDRIPIGGDTIRYVMIGQIEEAKSMLLSEP
jgi:hypothetical protein